MLCVFNSFILDVKFVDVPAGVPQEEGHTGFLRLLSAVLGLIFIVGGKKSVSHLFPSSTVKSNFVCPRMNRSPLLVGHDLLLFFLSTSEGFEVTN